MNSYDALPLRHAIFLDRDGVINENRDDHVTSWEHFRFLPGALEALRLLTERRYRIFVVTNQAAVGRGLISRAELETIHQRMRQEAARQGGEITDICYCPHRPEEACGCRKPQPGMLLSLAARQAITLRDTYLIGDALSDVMAGASVGCRTILVRTGRGAAQLAHPAWAQHQPNHVAADLLAAVQIIERERQLASSLTATTANSDQSGEYIADETSRGTKDAHVA